MSRRGASGARLLAVAALLLSTAGCARLLRSNHIAPSGLQSHEDRLRYMLATNQAPTAFAGFTSSHNAPGDDVLRALYSGIIAYYAHDYAESARVLDIAAELADDRITKSISRSALSLVTNDVILPYEPGRTERLMIPYYAALARLGADDIEGAAVEARRLSLLLQLHGDDYEPIDPALEATLRYVAGAIFEAHGDRNDADVAYRNAAALDPALPTPAESQRAAGTVIVVLEQGFVAHRVEQGLSMLILPEEMDLIVNGDSDERSSALSFVAARALQHATQTPDFAHGPYRPTTLHVPVPEDRSLIPRRRPKVVCRSVEDEAGSQGDSVKAVPIRNGSPERREVCREETVQIDEAPHLLKVAWPVYQAESRVSADARVLAAADTVAFGGHADVSDGVVADFREERALVIARTIARGAAKLTLTKGAEKKLEEKNEAVGAIIGLLGNIGSVLLERADTRSWHLLPAGISVARVPLPPGEHTLSVQVGARTVELEPVAVGAGEVKLVTARVW